MKFRVLTILLVLYPFAPLGAEEEEVLPSGYPVTRYTAIWENSPFNREIVKVVAQAIESSFSQTLVLEGIVNDDTLGSIAYVRDVAEDKPLVITRTASDSHPYTIVSSNQTNNPEETKVTLTDGNETGDIGYVVSKLTQAIAQPAVAAQQRTPQNPAKGGGSNPATPVPGGGGMGGGNQAGGGRVPGNLNPLIKPEDPAQPQSVTPALDNMDAEPRRRRVPLPGN